jgi:Skp family chaperone for outer membrane proteins
MIHMLLKATLAVLASILLIGVAHAETAVPDRLVIGYDNEGKIDASPAACLASVKEITEWDKAQTEKGARQVCAMRKRHVEAYSALQSNYKNFVKAFSVDQRLNLPSAVSNLKLLIKACMEHKSGLTTGGHNIMIDIIENNIAAQCLTLGSNLIKGETAKYNAL